MKCLTIILASLMLYVGGVAHGAQIEENKKNLEQEKSIKDFKVNSYNILFDMPLSKRNRLQFAKIFLAEIKLLDNAIPFLSPSEERWVQKEESEASGMRLLNLFKSLEYNKARAKELTSALVNWLELIVQSELEELEEAKVWAHIASELTTSRGHEGVKVLVVKNLVSKDVATYVVQLNHDVFEKGYTETQIYIGATILSKIVVPLLGKIKLPVGNK
jgi:hypothetical protein